MTKVGPVLGRLPSKYRLAIWIAGLVTFAVGGAWLALSSHLPLMWSRAALLGAAVGVLVVSGYLHLLERDAGPRSPAPGR
jgi:hypothetical protein